MPKNKPLCVAAWADKNLNNDWTATVTSPPALAGVFGIGATMHEARKALASNIAVIPQIAAEYAQVRVLTVTRKTFAVADLTASNS